MVEPAIEDGLLEKFGLCRGERFRGAGLGLDLRRGEDDIMPRVSQGVSTQILADGLQLELSVLAPLLIGMVLGVGSAVGERVVFVGLLRVGVRAGLEAKPGRDGAR